MMGLITLHHVVGERSIVMSAHAHVCVDLSVCHTHAKFTTVGLEYYPYKRRHSR